MLVAQRKEYADEANSSFPEDNHPTNTGHSITTCRSVRLKLLWRDPEFRAKNLAGRRASHVLLKQSTVVRERWKNPQFRKKVCEALKGRSAWNKGKRLSRETRIRMSIAAKKRHELKKDKLMSSSSNILFVENQQHCELSQVLLQRLQYLYKDLKLWSDGFRSTYTRLPRMSDVEKSCAPILLLKINRYLELRNILRSKPYCMNFGNMVILKEDTEKEYKQIFLDGKEIR
ncbi:hypothetical protein Gasu2_32830 [Galdieria sulphuraria]|uniref:Nuclease associated modular domain-containing protein n=1 Tax=Galdieria sulphuraria TaxID=130081 RepID=M2XKE8_GALSU|nr:uncharacterized protein Gasu_20730 [Galdieria sulphuraria]EME30612.1 hypothetical protein Gasu_20730 [Galdieria sulphuraria]GJD09009.1 hypothetical protein Gasu2_32830 [Galdieria sulphuraria]|eukprot:XP_005707132.1 hypothetical protein Gasu_20730 [Galdieria sulphuraria]